MNASVRSRRARGLRTKASDAASGPTAETVVRAHFNGEVILLDEPCHLEPDAELLVTVLPGRVYDSDRADWLRVSQSRLAEACPVEEPEYTLDMVKEPNPAYDGR